eukprot:1880757-Amphidinium_carterae.1
MSQHGSDMILNFYALSLQSKTECVFGRVSGRRGGQYHAGSQNVQGMGVRDVLINRCHRDQQRRCDFG